MITATSKFRVSLLSGFLVFALGSSAQAQWQHFADFSDTRVMVAAGDQLAGASSRGGWLYNPALDEWNHLSVTDGLYGVDQMDVCLVEGSLFFVALDAALSACDQDGTHWSRGFLEFRDNQQIVQLSELSTAGSHLLACHSTGATLLHYTPESDEFLVDWNVHTIGEFPVQHPVLAGATLGTRIVLATDLGLAVGGGFPVLPAAFETFMAPGGLEGVTRARLVSNDERIFALLSDGVGTSTCWSIGETGEWQEELLGEELNKVFALSASGMDWAIAWSDGTTNHLRRMGERSFDLTLLRAPSSMAFLNDDLWLALPPESDDGGLQMVDESGVSEFFSPDVAGAEEFVDLDLAPDGSLWAVGVSNAISRNGLYHWENDSWEAHRAGYEFFGNYPTSVLADSHDNIWFGTWGRGLGHFDPTSGEWQSFKHDTPDGQHMVGYFNDQVGESETFCLVSDVQEDPAGNIWIVNHQARDDSCIVVIPATWHQSPTQPFARTHFEQDGVRFPYTILPDTPGSIWISIGGKDARDNEKRVLHLLSYGHPASELPEWQLNESLLASPTFNFGEDEPGIVSDMSADADGSIWVSTDNGIYYGGMYGNLEQFSRIQFIAGLLSEVVSTVTVDDRGRIWMASSEGLNLFIPEELRFQTPPVVAAFNAIVTRLAGLQIHRICVNGDTGEVWLATNQGLFMSPTGGENYGTQSAQSLTVYPNPLHPERGERARVLREGLSNDASFAIYSADGYLLRRMKLAEMEVGWDGRDDTGALVPAGVYVVLAVHNGESESTLLAVIR